MRRISSRNFGARHAFSLIEMMCVIVVIAIIAALLFPALDRGRASARSIKCASNLRQIGVAAQAWSADNDGKIVSVYDPGQGGQSDAVKNWTAKLAPYLGRTSTASTFASVSETPVYVCPALPGYFGYGYNYLYLSWVQSSQTRNQWIRYSQVTRAAQTVMLVDNCNLTDKTSWKPFVRPPSLAGKYPDVGVDFRHPGNTANVLWVDGHVSAEKNDDDFMNVDDRSWQAQ